VREPLATSGALAGRDPKSALQEAVQAHGRLPPSYRVVGTYGPAHERMFQVEVVLGDRVLARGEGPSKRLAERAAAAAALEAQESTVPGPSDASSESNASHESSASSASNATDEANEKS